MNTKYSFFFTLLLFFACNDHQNNQVNVADNTNVILEEIDEINLSLKELEVEIEGFQNDISMQENRLEGQKDLIINVKNEIEKANEFQLFRTEDEKNEEINELNSYLNDYLKVEKSYKEILEETENKRDMLINTYEKLKNDKDILKSKLKQ